MAAEMQSVCGIAQAAVNFGQYSYSGYFPNYPTSARRAIPADDDADAWAEMKSDPDKAFCHMFSSKRAALEVCLSAASAAFQAQPCLAMPSCIGPN